MLLNNCAGSKKSVINQAMDKVDHLLIVDDDEEIRDLLKNRA